MPPKPMKEPETIGERLRKRRESLGLSVKNIADDIQAHVRYVEALESDSYDVFSAKIYALGFLKKMFVALAFEDREQMLKEFDSEWEVRTYRTREKVARVPENRGQEPFITPRRLSIIIAAAVGVLLLVFLGFRLIRFVRKPQFFVRTPQNMSVVYRPVIHVEGLVEKESQLTVNGREITVDEVGEFSEAIELQVGVNELNFLAQDRFGKENKIVRYVLVK